LTGVEFKPYSANTEVLVEVLVESHLAANLQPLVNRFGRESDSAGGPVGISLGFAREIPAESFA
jgi:hypothetical protein